MGAIGNWIRNGDACVMLGGVIILVQRRLHHLNAEEEGERMLCCNMECNMTSNYSGGRKIHGTTPGSKMDAGWIVSIRFGSVLFAKWQIQCSVDED